jgi:hypothetical protein
LELQHTKAKNLEPQHKASTHQSKKCKTLMQSFNTQVDQRLWSFNAPKQRTWSLNTKLQRTRAKNLELQHKASTHQSKKCKTLMQSFNTQVDQRLWSFNAPKQRTWSLHTKLQRIKAKNLESQHKA